MAITVENLSEKTAGKDPSRAREVLLCQDCGTTYSANKGDYFQVSLDSVFTCCDVPMVLAVPYSGYTILQ